MREGSSLQVEKVVFVRGAGRCGSKNLVANLAHLPLKRLVGGEGFLGRPFDDRFETGGEASRPTPQLADMAIAAPAARPSTSPYRGATGE